MDFKYKSVKINKFSNLILAFLFLFLVPLPPLRLKGLPHLGGGDWRQVFTNQLPLPPVTFDRLLTAQLGIAVPVVPSSYKPIITDNM